MTELPGGPRLSLIYVGGYGRSGSSLLDSLTAARGAALSGGELTSLFQWYAQDRNCTCGQPLQQCPLWGQVVPGVQTSLGRSAAELHHASTQAEYHGGDEDTWRAIWSEVFGQLRDVHGIRRVVDSSKSARANRRTHLLRGLKAVDSLTFVHLHRELAGVVNSRRRGSNIGLEDGSRSRGTLDASLRALWGWSRANQAARRETALAERSITVSYAALCDAPELIVEEVLSAAGWPPHPARTAHPAQTTETLPHSIAGNRMLRTARSAPITADTAWRQDLPWFWRQASHAVQRLGQARGIVPAKDSPAP